MTKAILFSFAGMLAVICLAADSPKTSAPPTARTRVPAGTLVLGQGARLRIVSAGRGNGYNSGGLTYALPGMTDEEEVVTVVGRIVSGKPSEDDLKPWLTDKSGARATEPTGLTKDNERTWLFKVPKSASALVLHFPGGASLPLSSLLQKKL